MLKWILSILFLTFDDSIDPTRVFPIEESDKVTDFFIWFSGVAIRL